MQYAVGRVRALADRIEQLEKASIKIPALTTLGSTVCEQDKPLARAILLRARGLLPALDLEFADTPPPDPQRPEMTRAYTLRQSLYTAVARCDPDLAVRLRDSERKERVAEPTSASLDLATAYTLLGPDTTRAADFASRALDFSMSRNEFQRFAMFLVQLHKKNAPVADDLFLRALAQLRAQSKPDSYLLTALGTYFFTYTDPLKDSRALDGMGFVIIGKIGVISLAGNRPNVLQAQVRAYLEASADVLSRPTTDSTAQQYDYATAFQLLPKARQFAPDLAPTFDLILRRLDPNIPEQLKAASEERLALARKIFRNPEQQVEDFEKATDPIERDRLRYPAVVALLDKGEYERARSIARDLDDKVPRDLLLRVVEFVEAAKAIERGPLESALVLSRKFSAGAVVVLPRKPIFDTNIFGHVQDGLIPKGDWRFLLRQRPGHGWPLSAVSALELLAGLPDAPPAKFLKVREQIELAYKLSKGRVLEEPRFLLCKEVLRVPFPTKLERIPPAVIADHMEVVAALNRPKTFAKVVFESGDCELGEVVMQDSQDSTRQWLRN